jgi:hypothetical protein
MSGRAGESDGGQHHHGQGEPVATESETGRTPKHRRPT